MKKRLLIAVVVVLVQGLSSSGLGAPKNPAGAREPSASRGGLRPASRGDRPRAPRPARKVIVEAVPATVPAAPALHEAGPRIRMARWLLERGDPARAYVEATAAILRDADSAEAYFLRGCAALDVGMITEAALDLESAVILAPDYGQAFEQLGFAFLLAGEAKRAADAFGRATALLDEPASEGSGVARMAEASPSSPAAPEGVTLRAEGAPLPYRREADLAGPNAKRPEDDLSGADLQERPSLRSQHAK